VRVDDPHARLRLRDRERAAGEVDVPSLERERLADPKPCAAGVASNGRPRPPRSFAEESSRVGSAAAQPMSDAASSSGADAFGARAGSR
jgi:hypothetical protein